MVKKFNVCVVEIPRKVKENMATALFEEIRAWSFPKQIENEQAVDWESLTNTI